MGIARRIQLTDDQKNRMPQENLTLVDIAQMIHENKIFEYGHDGLTGNFELRQDGWWPVKDSKLFCFGIPRELYNDDGWWAR